MKFVGQRFLPFKVMDQSCWTPTIRALMFSRHEQGLPPCESFKLGAFMFVTGAYVEQFTNERKWIITLATAQVALYNQHLELIWHSFPDIEEYNIISQLKELKTAAENASSSLETSAESATSVPGSFFTVTPKLPRTFIGDVSAEVNKPYDYRIVVKVLRSKQFDRKYWANIWDGSGETNHTIGNSACPRDGHENPTYGKIISIFIWNNYGREFAQTVRSNDWVSISGILPKMHRNDLEINSRDHRFSFQVLQPESADCQEALSACQSFEAAHRQAALQQYAPYNSVHFPSRISVPLQQQPTNLGFPYHPPFAGSILSSAYASAPSMSPFQAHHANSAPISQPQRVIPSALRTGDGLDSVPQALPQLPEETFPMTCAPKSTGKRRAESDLGSEHDASRRAKRPAPAPYDDSPLVSQPKKPDPTSPTHTEQISIEESLVHEDLYLPPDPLSSVTSTMIHLDRTQSDAPVTYIGNLENKLQHVKDDAVGLFKIRARFASIQPRVASHSLAQFLASTCPECHSIDGYNTPHDPHCPQPPHERCLAFRIMLDDGAGASAITVQVVGKSAEHFIGMSAASINSELGKEGKFLRVMRALQLHEGKIADFFILAEPLPPTGKRVYRLFGTRFINDF